MKQLKNSGMALHLNHDILFKWCWGLKERIKVINTRKPKGERKIRKMLLRLLTEEEVAMLPTDFVKECKEESEAKQKWEEANQKWEEAKQKWEEAYQEWEEACGKYSPQLKEVHKKICDCKEWNGREMVFK